MTADDEVQALNLTTSSSRRGRPSLVPVGPGRHLQPGPEEPQLNRSQLHRDRHGDLGVGLPVSQSAVCPSHVCSSSSCTSSTRIRPDSDSLTQLTGSSKPGSGPAFQHARASGQPESLRRRTRVRNSESLADSESDSSVPRTQIGLEWRGARLSARATQAGTGSDPGSFQVQVVGGCLDDSDSDSDSESATASSAVASVRHCSNADFDARLPRAWPVAGSRTLLPSTIESESQFQDEFESESAVVLEARRALLLYSELDPRAMASSDSTSTRSHCQRTRNNLNQRDSEPEASTIRRATRAVAAGSAVTSRDSDSTKFKPECNLKLKLKRRQSTGALSGRRTTTARGLPDRPGRAVTALGPGPPSPLTGSPALSGHYAGPGHGHGGPPTRTPSLSSWQLDSEPGAPARAGPPGGGVADLYAGAGGVSGSPDHPPGGDGA